MKEEPQDRSRGWVARFGPPTLIVLAFSYLVWGQWLIAYDIGRDGQYWFLTGKPSVIQSGDVLALALLEPTNSVSLVFKHELRAPPRVMLTSSEAIRVEWSPSNARRLVIRGKTSPIGTSGGTEANLAVPGWTAIQLAAGAMHQSPDKRHRELTAVTVDGAAIDPIRFLESHLDETGSSLVVHYPMALENLSELMARSVGPKALMILVLLLMVLFGAQCLLFTIWLKQLSPKLEWINSIENNPTVKSLDNLSDQGAIPMGLFGTILGVWLALEQPGTQFSSFNEILAILRAALFTSVLGMSVKVAHLVRTKLFSEPYDTHG